MGGGFFWDGGSFSIHLTVSLSLANLAMNL